VRVIAVILAFYVLLRVTAAVATSESNVTWCVPGCKIDRTAGGATAAIPPWCLAWTDGSKLCSRAGEQVTCTPASQMPADDLVKLKFALDKPFVRQFPPSLPRPSLTDRWAQSPLLQCKTVETTDGWSISCAVPNPQHTSSANSSSDPAASYCYKIETRVAANSDLQGEQHRCMPGCLFPKSLPLFRRFESEPSLSAHQAPKWCEVWSDGCAGCSRMQQSSILTFLGWPQSAMCTLMACTGTPNYLTCNVLR
jgi:hypothetical protein